MDLDNKVAEENSAAEEEKNEKDDKKKPKRVLGKILNYLEWALLIASFGFVIYAFSCTAKGKVVNFFGRSLLHVVTGSMEPTIATGEFILTKRVNPQDLKVDDIVSYYSEDPEIAGKLVIHRIKEINEDGTFITMGDANPVPDELPVRPDQIQGIYTGRDYVFNWISSFTDPRKLLLMLVVVPIFLLSIYEAGTLTKLIKVERKKANPEKEAEKAKAYDAAVEDLKKKAIEEYLEAQNAVVQSAENENTDGEKPGSENIEGDNTECENPNGPAEIEEEVQPEKDESETEVNGEEGKEE